MTNDELIARQAKHIEELQDALADMIRRVDNARALIYCIGGPLNDNKHWYTRPQLAIFYSIAEELGH